ncbi:MAG: NAD(P)-dependent dehydrogenase (short-subunit alcohol dehydrogenase family) [Cyclobacteriaceae bacterium]|jgi:NAD(P)-dependent dehydrogenase (short-subunit alcohol dehydrogenase family)
MDFKGKVALVTGAGGVGIGNGIAKILSSFGATVILNDINDDLANKGAETIPNAVPYGADLRDKKQVDQMFQETIVKFGAVDFLVNNAGVGNSTPAHKTEEDKFDFLYSLDVKSVWYLSKLFAQHHIENKTSGNIVNVSSVNASATLDGFGLYASAKSAVEGLTRGMSVELGKHNIRVNAIAPGYVHSDQGLDLIATWAPDANEWVRQHIDDYQVLNFQILPEDCGNVVAFLLSELSRTVTGQVIFTDNGLIRLLYSRDYVNMDNIVRS